MARVFNGSTQYATATNTLNSVALDFDQMFTVCAWVKPADETALSAVAGVHRSTSFQRYIGIALRGDQAGDPISLHYAIGSLNYLDHGSADYAASTWYFIAASYDHNGGTREGKINVDGSSTGPSAITGTSNVIDELILAGVNTGSGTIGNYFNGSIGYVGFWNGVTSDANLTSLANGAAFDTIDTGNMLDWWDLTTGSGSTATGQANSTTLTFVNNPTQDSEDPLSGGGGGGNNNNLLLLGVG